LITSYADCEISAAAAPNLRTRNDRMPVGLPQIWAKGSLHLTVGSGQTQHVFNIKLLSRYGLHLTEKNFD